MDFKLLGSILLIIGTSIGAGMLALPIATAQLGFVGSVVLLVGCWFVMTSGALLILEVNLWMPQNSNLITMAKSTIGPIGQLVAWVSFILLLYSLLAAYIAGGSDVFHNLLVLAGIEYSQRTAATLFVLIFASVVYFGIRAVDYTNRALMIMKLSSYLLLVLMLTPLISIPNLSTGSLEHITSIAAVMVTLTSFGFATIVPSLRIYFAGDVRKLKLAILIGSIIPLICYILWDAAIMGVIPLNGTNSLVSILHADNSTSALINTLNDFVAQGSAQVLIKLFTSICVVTSFLGVGICLVDFLADGLQLEKTGAQKLLTHIITFVPPFCIAIFLPRIFINALAYAGIYSLVLLILLPAWMAWRGRYRKHYVGSYTVPGGKLLLSTLIGFSLIIGLLFVYYSWIN